MARFDRYIVTRLLTTFGFFALILVAIFWINRAVFLFDQLIANGHSTVVFLQFTSLNLPNIIRLVLPVAGFAAVVWAINRLNADSELVVIQATGFSPWRLARPVVTFGAILFLLMSFLTHWLTPATRAELNLREAAISQDLTARFLREGAFIHPARGVTFFVGEITEDGLLKEVFLEEARPGAPRTTYTAQRALLLKEGSQVRLVMLGGLAQSLSEDGAPMSITRFDDLLIDITSYLDRSQPTRQRPELFTTAELLQGRYPLQDARRTQQFAVQVHERIAQSLLAPVAALIGFAALLIGSFSRFGLWRQIALAVTLIVLISGADNSFIAAAREPGAWPGLIYLGPLLGLVFALSLLWLAGRPALLSRHKGRVAA